MKELFSYLTFLRPNLVRLGAVNLAGGGNASAQVDVNIKRVTRHQNYNSIDEANDIALLELENKVEFHERYLRPACLKGIGVPGMNITAVLNWKTYCQCIHFYFQTGWGKRSSYSQTSDHLMKVSLPIVDFEECNSMVKGTRLNEKAQMCAGGIRGKVRKQNLFIKMVWEWKLNVLSKKTIQ